MLNLVHYSADEGVPFNSRNDKPAWERDEPVRPADRPFDGYLDLLTWQSRRVKLVPELNADGQLIGVSGVVAMKGWQLPGFDRYGRETMVGFVKPEKVQSGQDPWPPLGFRAGKELWRDSHTLFQSIAEKSERPKVLSWVDDLRQDGHLDRKQVQLDVYGVSADRAKIFYWRHESLPLPLGYLNDTTLIEVLREALTVSEDVREALRTAAWATLANRLAGDTGLNPDKDRVGKLLESFAPERLYWSRLERPYRGLLVSLAGAATPEDRSARVRNWFHDILHPTAMAAFDNTVGRVDRGRDLKAVAIGRGMLLGSLKKVQKKHTFPDHELKEGAA